MKNRSPIILGSLAIALLLSACSSARESFDCPGGVGVGCKSITQVNEMVDRGLLGGSTQDLEEPFEKTHLSSFDRPASLRVWVAPYEEDNSVQTEASYMVLGE